MVWLPTAGALVASVATPPASVAAGPSPVAPSKIVTAPVGVPEPGAAAVTRAVNVTDCPKTAAFGDELAARVAAPCRRVWLKGVCTLPPALLVLKLLSPL